MFGLQYPNGTYRCFEPVQSALGGGQVFLLSKEALRQWEYQPTLLNGEPVDVIAPIEVNCTIPGSAHATVKNECGARLSTPSAEVVETQAIGRGTTTELSRR